MSSEAGTLALVTGAGRRGGLGFAVCRQLASQGMSVLLSGRDGDQAEVLARSLAGEGLAVTGHALDITNEDSVRRVTEELERRGGTLHVLVNNAAGLGTFGEQAATADLAAAEALMAATVFGTWRLCQACLPYLRRSGAGRLVNVSSGAGSHGDAAFGLTSGNGMGAAYGVAKAAVNALTARLAYEEGETGVLINAVCPGWTATFPGGEAMGARPVAQGAASIVWAALLPAGGPHGGFFRDGQPLPW